MGLDLLQPSVDVTKAIRTIGVLFIIQVPINGVDHHSQGGVPVKATDEGAVDFLSAGVPDLKFDAFVVDSQGEGEELKADGGFVALVEGVFYGLHCKTALTNPRVADYYYFEAEVILGKIIWDYFAF